MQSSAEKNRRLVLLPCALAIKEPLYILYCKKANVAQLQTCARFRVNACSAVALPMCVPVA